MANPKGPRRSSPCSLDGDLLGPFGFATALDGVSLEVWKWLCTVCLVDVGVALGT